MASIPRMRVVRPKDLDPDKSKEITKYLLAHWERAENGRAEQVDDNYRNWDKAYRGVPAQKERSFPWRGASNIVVPLIRMHLDTFVARTLGIVMAVTPLIKIKGLPQEQADALEMYTNYKTNHQWQFYPLARDILTSGNKNGTVATKIPWVEMTAIDVMPGDGEDAEAYQETETDIYVGPKPETVPFEDFYVYPITATKPDQVLIKFFKQRYVAEQVKELIDSGKWAPDIELSTEVFDKQSPEEQRYKTISKFIHAPSDVKKLDEQMDAGVVDPLIDELHVVECYFRYALGGKWYDMVALIVPEGKMRVDLYFNPFPRNIPAYDIYRPFPRESLFYGESHPEILAAFQEEVSAIHNDRRNNSYIANSPLFTRKNGSGIPNPSGTWYPGKVFDVENADDFGALNIGRNYDSMLDQEGWILQLSERVSGVGAQQQAFSQGSSAKRGVYSSQGTMALLGESNERQGTNIRDFRESLSCIAKTCFLLQKTFQPDDPAIAFFAPKDQEKIRAALEYASPARTHLCPFEVRASSSQANKEVDRQNLMQMVGVLSTYYQQVTGMSQQLLNPGINPGLRMILEDTVTSMATMAKRVLRAFDEIDPEKLIPDVQAAVQSQIPGQWGSTAPQGEPTPGGTGQYPVQPGGTGMDGAPLTRERLAGLSALPRQLPQTGGVSLT